MDQEHQKGFSLLELLVVIGIIGVLVSIGTVAFRTAQERARDTRRRGDIEAISRSLEQYYSVNFNYPLANDCAGYETYISSATPTDPQTGGTYIQSGDCEVDGSQYCVCALLEAEDSGNAYAKSGGANSSCNFSSGSGTKDYYCVQSQQ